VVIATRSRPEALRECVASVLESRHDSFEVIVVEQSEAPTPLPDDSRINHIMSATRGKSAALNVGIAAAKAKILAFTDDDCTVGPEWLERAGSLLGRHPEVGLAFGNLNASPHDPTVSYVPIAQMGHFEVLEGCRAVRIRGGAGADLVARRSLFTTIGGFDEEIGPGSRFPACEEFDLYYRALAAGCSVARAPELEVTHWGARPYADGSGQALQRAYEYGEGVVLGKHLRLRDPRIVRPVVEILVWGLPGFSRALVGGDRHQRDLYLCRVRGLLAGLSHPVDRQRRVFERPRTRRADVQRYHLARTPGPQR
jgi:hypothetical protein